MTKREIKIEIPEGIDLSDSTIQTIIDHLSGDPVHSLSSSSAAAILAKETPKSVDVAKAEVAKAVAKENPQTKVVTQPPDPEPDDSK